MISFDVIVNVWFIQSREQKLILGLVELLCDPGRGSFPHTVLRWIKIHLQACALRLNPEHKSGFVLADRPNSDTPVYSAHRRKI